MKTYSKDISLTRNDRGVYCIDTTIGCASGLAENPKGCYGDCYAYRSAKIYGYDFSKTVLRDFKNSIHKNEILRQIAKVKLPFVRIGCSGDPSENWEHSVKIIREISHSLNQYDLFYKGKPRDIVVITRHWNMLTNEQLLDLSECGNVVVNTSVSAIDSVKVMIRAIDEYERLKPFVKSVLRVVSFDFNKENPDGKMYSEIQDILFKNELVIDTVFRPTKNNPLVTDGIIKVKKSKFLGNNALVSKFNRKAYLGKCDSCKEMCGSTMG
jgi:hypothetical protein